MKAEFIDCQMDSEENIILGLEKHYLIFQEVKKILRNTEIGLSFLDNLARYVNEKSSYKALLVYIREKLLTSTIPITRQQYLYTTVDKSSLKHEFERIKFEQNELDTSRKTIFSRYKINCKRNALTQGCQQRIRTLDFFMQNGFTLAVSEAGREQLMKVYKMDPHASLLVSTNALHIFENYQGLPTSASWVNIGHDIFDHGWFSRELVLNGLVEKYQDFFAKIGQPFNTDILSFKGEVLSTIMFGWRDTHHATELDFGGEGFRDLAKILGWSERKPSKNEIRLGSIWNAVLRTFEVVYMRKVGPVFELDPGKDYRVKNNLNLRNREFAQLVVDSVALINKKRFDLNTSCISVYVMVEGFLQDVVMGKITGTPQLVLRLQDIESGSYEKRQRIPESVYAWLTSHAWFDTDWRRR